MCISSESIAVLDPNMINTMRSILEAHYSYKCKSIQFYVLIQVYEFCQFFLNFILLTSSDVFLFSISMIFALYYSLPPSCIGFILLYFFLFFSFLGKLFYLKPFLISHICIQYYTFVSQQYFHCIPYISIHWIFIFILFSVIFKNFL